MTVSELISYLQQFDGDCLVLTAFDQAPEGNDHYIVLDDEVLDPPTPPWAEAENE